MLGSHQGKTACPAWIIQQKANLGYEHQHHEQSYGLNLTPASIQQDIGTNPMETQFNGASCSLDSTGKYRYECEVLKLFLRHALLVLLPITLIKKNSFVVGGGGVH